MCRLTVLAPEGAWQGEVSSWTGLVVLAALSDEPESLGELAEALRRYQPEHDLFAPPRPLRELGPVLAGDGVWCLLDLVGRTVVAGDRFELPDLRGAYQADEEDLAEGSPVVWLATPADWLFRTGSDGWVEVVLARTAARAAVQLVDARAVLFGRPLLDYLADSVLAAVVPDPTEENARLERTRAIHAHWLMTTRADLGGQTPREMLLAKRNQIAWDLEQRSRQWSLQGHAPPPLPPDSTAYRLGGFGTTEVVLYFELVRALLSEAWKQVEQTPRPTRPQLVQRLTEFRGAWLHTPYEGSSLLMTPVNLIESERQRMPVAGDGSHLFDDCPICEAMRAEEEEFGPTFMWFDGHRLELEEEYAFSLCATREEWDEQQEEYQQFAEKMDRQAREQAGYPEDKDPLGDSVWQRSFVDWDVMAGPGSSPREALLAFTFPLAELVSDLQERPDGEDLLRSLNQAYGRLRTSQDKAGRDTAAQELRELLEEVCRKFPDLTAKSADLQSRLDEVVRRWI
jgi:hypothetical protein